MDPNNVTRFKKLFTGLDSAYGIGSGGWVREPPTWQHYADHLEGKGPGLGIAPLMRNEHVNFAAIDLDEPDFEMAKLLASLLPGTQFIESSRSGNAHIFAFFRDQIPAWIPRGIMREACAAVGRRNIEVFPKQDKLRLGMVGNYINLPLYGNTRPIVGRSDDSVAIINFEDPLSLQRFLDEAEAALNDNSDWAKRARWLGIPSPAEREVGSHAQFGTQTVLHECAEYVLQNRELHPVVAGHRAVVYFSLAKMFANCKEYTDEEALILMALINDASPDPITEGELRRIYKNAVRGQFTSTGCDDPLFIEYASPTCRIAHPELKDKK